MRPLSRRQARLLRGRHESLDLLRGQIFANLRKIAACTDDPYILFECRENVRVLKTRYRIAICDLTRYPRPELPAEITFARDIKAVAIGAGYLGKRMRIADRVSA